MITLFPAPGWGESGDGRIYASLTEFPGTGWGWTRDQHATTYDQYVS